MYKYKSVNFDIYSSKNNITKEVIKICSRAYNINKEFFKKDIKKINITLSNSEKEFKEKLGKWYRVWVKGLGEKGSIIIRSPKEYIKCYKKYFGTPSFETLLTHEINHIFAAQLKLYNGPYWMTEGLAMYTAKQIPGKTYNKKVKFTKEKAKSYLIYRKIYSRLTDEMYIPQYFAIKYLVDNFGEDKLRLLFKKYKTNMLKPEFEKKFKTIFKISYSKFLKEFIEQFEYK